MRKANRKMKKLTVTDGLTDPNYGKARLKKIVNKDTSNN